jgi:hypothetical protein
MASKPKNIILIVSDSLRFDSVYRGEGPGLRYMQQHGIQFTNARSAACWTLPGTASLFSGLMPHEHGATTQTRWFRDELPSLASKLKTQGYKPLMVTANSVTTDVFNLCKDFDEVHKVWEYVDSRHPMILRLVLTLNKPRIRKLLMKPNDEIFSRLTEDLSQGLVWAQKTCTDLFDKTRELMRNNNDKEQPCFFFLNMMETHYPYHINDVFELVSKSLTGKVREWHTFYHLLSQSFMKTDKEIIKKDMLALMQGRQQKAWQLVKDNLDAFVEELHKDENNLVVFCSDHGDNFGDQGWQYHFNNVTDAGNRVPIIWMGQDHPAPQTLDHKVSSRYIHHSILEAAGFDKQEANLFEESAKAMPILQSYWYNNDGKTMEKYKYNQFCFIEGDDRYVQRAGKWLQAPVSKDGMEQTFQPIGEGINPIEELKLDDEKKKYLLQTATNFSRFSDEIMKKSLKK